MSLSSHVVLFLILYFGYMHFTPLMEPSIQNNVAWLFLLLLLVFLCIAAYTISLELLIPTFFPKYAHASLGEKHIFEHYGPSLFGGECPACKARSTNQRKRRNSDPLRREALSTGTAHSLLRGRSMSLLPISSSLSGDRLTSNMPLKRSQTTARAAHITSSSL